MRRTRFRWSVLLTIAIGCLAMTHLLAQGRARARMGQQRLYDPATEVTVKGSILEIQHPPSDRASLGVHLILKTDAGTVEVHLSPARFLAANQISLSKGDRVEVTGSEIKYRGADALIARELKIGNKTLRLRDSQGVPQWNRGTQGGPLAASGYGHCCHSRRTAAMS